MLPIRLTRRRLVVGPSPPRSQIPLFFVASQPVCWPTSAAGRYRSPFVKTAQAIRAILLAMANRSNVHMRALFQTVSPSRYGRSSIPHKVQYSPRTMDETACADNDCRASRYRSAWPCHLSMSGAEPGRAMRRDRAPWQNCCRCQRRPQGRWQWSDRLRGISISRCMSVSALASVLISVSMASTRPLMRGQLRRHVRQHQQDTTRQIRRAVFRQSHQFLLKDVAARPNPGYRASIRKPRP